MNIMQGRTHILHTKPPHKNTGIYSSLLREGQLAIKNGDAAVSLKMVISLTGSALYWTLWVLPLIISCKHSSTETSINVASPGAGLPECARISPYKRRPHLLTVILHLSSASGIGQTVPRVEGSVRPLVTGCLNSMRNS